MSHFGSKQGSVTPGKDWTDDGGRGRDIEGSGQKTKYEKDVVRVIRDDKYQTLQENSVLRERLNEVDREGIGSVVELIVEEHHILVWRSEGVGGHV